MDEINKFCDFVAYVDSFYGPKGIYSMNATATQIANAIKILLKKEEEMYYDSIDREMIRDIMIKEFGLDFVQK